MNRYKRKRRIPHVYGDTLNEEVNQLWQKYLDNKYKINIQEIKEETQDESRLNAG